MVYEARHSPMINHALAGACLLLSILRFAAAVRHHRPDLAD